MDANRTFEETELTKLVLVALNYAVRMLPDGDYQVTDNGRIVGEDYKRLMNKIKKEKLDIRLVSREY
jgi:hypothetical protein